MARSPVLVIDEILDAMRLSGEVTLMENLKKLRGVSLDTSPSLFPEVFKKIESMFGNHLSNPVFGWQQAVAKILRDEKSDDQDMDEIIAQSVSPYKD